MKAGLLHRDADEKFAPVGLFEKTILCVIKTIAKALILLLALPAFSQVIISGNAADVVNPRAMLEVRSTNKGLLIPRMTEAQRLLTPGPFNPLPAPAQGLTVYQTDRQQGYYYNTSTNNIPNWVYLFNSGSADVWQTLGNPGLLDGVHFLGTTTNVPLNFKVNNKNAGRIDPINRNVTLGRHAGNALFITPDTIFFRPPSTDNVIIGDSAGFKILSFGRNSFVGARAGKNTIGSDNSFFGERAGLSNTAGSRNVAIGVQALLAQSFLNNGNPYNSENVAVGYSALSGTKPTASTNGNKNVAVGAFAGDGNTTGSSNTFIGWAADGSGTTFGGGIQNATAIGANALVTSSNSVVLGNNANVGIGISGPTAKLDIMGSGNTDVTKALRIINSSSKQLFIVENSGDVGIGTAQPAATLDVVGSGGNSATSHALSLRNSVLTTLMIVRDDGRVGLGTFFPDQRLSVNGNASKVGGGSWATFSDSRMKKDVHEFIDGLNVINQINPVSFQYNGLGGYPNDGKKYIGVIAQDVQKIAPYMIEVTKKKLNDADTEEKDLLMYDASALPYLVINAIKEQQQMIQELKNENQSLKNSLSQVQTKIQLIEAKSARVSAVK